MKSKCWLTMVCWALVCLVLGLIQQAGMYHSSQVSGSSQWLDRCREPASGSPTASVVESTQFGPARAGPLTSLVLEDAWSKRSEERRVGKECGARWGAYASNKKKRARRAGCGRTADGSGQ